MNSIFISFTCFFYAKGRKIEHFHFNSTKFTLVALPPRFKLLLDKNNPIYCVIEYKWIRFLCCTFSVCRVKCEIWNEKNWFQLRVTLSLSSFSNFNPSKCASLRFVIINVIIVCTLESASNCDYQNYFEWDGNGNLAMSSWRSSSNTHTRARQNRTFN